MVKWNPTPAPTLLGGAAVTISREAAAGVTVKAAVVAAVKLPLVAVSVNPVPADATPNEKVATPSTALMTTLPPPDRVSVTFPSYELSRPPSAPSASTTTVNRLPAVTLLGGWVVTTRWLAIS